jgi:hypothetical protein
MEQQIVAMEQTNAIAIKPTKIERQPKRAKHAQVTNSDAKMANV